MDDSNSPDQAAWRQNLAVIRTSILSRDADARERLWRATDSLDRDLRSLKEKRRLLALASQQNDAKPVHGGNRRLEIVISQKQTRRVQLSALRKLLADGESDKDGPPAEAMVQPSRKDPIEELARSGRLNQDQLRAAHEIRRIYESVSADLRSRVSDLGRPRERRVWRAGEVTANLAWARSHRFLPWANELRVRDPGTLDIVLRVVVFGLSLFAVSRRRRIGWQTCLDKLTTGLDLYWKKEKNAGVTAGNQGIPRPECP